MSLVITLNGEGGAFQTREIFGSASIHITEENPTKLTIFADECRIIALLASGCTGQILQIASNVAGDRTLSVKPGEEPGEYVELFDFKPELEVGQVELEVVKAQITKGRGRVPRRRDGKWGWQRTRE